MSIFTRLFGDKKRKPDTPDESGRVSCEYVADLIRQRTGSFRDGRGMALVLLEVCEIQLYFFNGTPRVSWDYTNHQLLIDRVGESSKEGPPVKLVLKVNDEIRFVKVIKKQFRDCDVSIHPLWHLDRSAPDYQMMEIMHRDDVGIRISFD